jgi:hypothetical protein
MFTALAGLGVDVGNGGVISGDPDIDTVAGLGWKEVFQLVVYCREGDCGYSLPSVSIIIKRGVI